MARRFEVVKGYEDKGINLPKRQTKHAAGYDFEAAEDIVIPSMWKIALKNMMSILNKSDEEVSMLNIKPTLVKTGVKALFNEDEVLYLYNRSSGPKNGRILSNSVGVVDADYYYSEKTGGHIMFAMYNNFFTDIKIAKGERIGQGIFQKFLLTDDDVPGGTRLGGFGDSGKSK